MYDRVTKMYGSAELLANVSQSTLAADLEPLGLHNKRAEQLIKTAKSLLEMYNGEVPRDSCELAGLPGVGPYIAHAVACFAYEQPTAVVDSNVARVLTRFFDLKFVGRPALSKPVWEFADNLIVETVLAKQYNYALLDFAAQVCAHRPKCSICPVRIMCQFFEGEERAKALAVAVQQPSAAHNNNRLGG